MSAGIGKSDKPEKGSRLIDLSHTVEDGLVWEWELPANVPLSESGAA